MICPECTAAAERTWGVFLAHCPGCIARQVSRSPAYAESREAGRILPAYRSMLARVGLDHQAVKAAAEADAMQKKTRTIEKTY